MSGPSKDPREGAHVSKNPGRMRIVKKGLFAKDLGPMMYGFGDAEQPAADTVQVMEELLTEHITDVCHQAHRISTNRGKIKVDDFKFALRNDLKKLARVEELLFMAEVIARARGKDDMVQYAEEEQALARREKERLEAVAGLAEAQTKAAGGVAGAGVDKSSVGGGGGAGGLKRGRDGDAVTPAGGASTPAPVKKKYKTKKMKELEKQQEREKAS